MKFYIPFIAVSCLVQSLSAQTTGTNYVKAYKAQVPLAGDISDINKKDSVSESIVYYDGLGREVQSVGKNASPLGKDMVTVSSYDGYSKRTINYLPYVSSESNGNYKNDPLTNQLSFYTTLFGGTDAARAYTQHVLERSELARVREQSSPGDAWKIGSTHTVKKEYRTNEVSDTVFLFRYNETTNEISVTPAHKTYSPNKLSCSRTIDEENNDVLEFVDKEGRTVCKKVKAPGGGYASTYYVYDDFGNLAVVIPPEGVNRIVNGN